MTKTIKVKDLIIEINRVLSLDNIDQTEKKALCYILETFLMRTKNYKGYLYPELFTQECSQWKKDNPDKEYSEYIKNDFNREYILNRELN
jgi:hypothetical protein